MPLERETSFGRSEQSRVVLDDPGLSRLNTTFFTDRGQIFVVDEGSLNGTFVNGRRIGSTPERVFQGDEITLGSGTRITVEIAQSVEPAAAHNSFTPAVSPAADHKPAGKEKPVAPRPATGGGQSNKPPFALIAAAASAFFIILFALVGIFITSRFENQSANGKKTPPRVNTQLAIPIRVIDPLGAGKLEDVADLVDVWDVQDKEVEATDLQDVTASVTDDNQPKGLNLKVSVAFWQEQRNKALAARGAPTGISPPGMQVPPELRGDGVIKQKAKLRDMLSSTPPYRQPMDFSELAQKRLQGELVELPMATEDYMLDVGGSASEGPFSAFSFEGGNALLTPGSPKMNTILQLAGNFSGEKYDINNPVHRKQMRIRLLRMFHPRAEPILRELAQAYRMKFNRPLRVTSLTRSMDYQIGLNKINPNSFKVRGAGSLPPHTSGCAFDLARKHMTAEEQNFVMAKLAEMERAGKLDALIEGNVNACFHVFIYNDGIPPKM